MRRDAFRELAFLILKAFTRFDAADIPVPEIWDCADDEFVRARFVFEDAHLVFRGSGY